MLGDRRNRRFAHCRARWDLGRDSMSELFKGRQFQLSTVVRAARVTTGALYHHFAGKSDLFRAVVSPTCGALCCSTPPM
jgi:hypothetical protein